MSRSNKDYRVVDIRPDGRLVIQAKGTTLNYVINFNLRCGPLAFHPLEWFDIGGWKGDVLDLVRQIYFRFGKVVYRSSYNSEVSIVTTDGSFTCGSHETIATLEEFIRFLEIDNGNR